MQREVDAPDTSGVPVPKADLPTGTVYHEPGEKRLRVSVVTGETPVGYLIKNAKPGRPLKLNELLISVRSSSTPSVPRPGHGRIITRKRILSVPQILKGMNRAARHDEDPQLIRTVVAELGRRLM